MSNMVTITMFNPFKGSDCNRQIDISEIIEREQFNALKEFITDHLKFGLREAKNIEGWTEYETTQYEYLIVQLYQPTNIDTLINKILKFEPVLYKVKEFKEVINHLKGGNERTY